MNRRAPAPDPAINELTAMLERSIVGKPEEAVTHEAPVRTLRFSRHRHGALKEPSIRKKKSILAKPTYIYSRVQSIPVQYRRFPRTSLVKTKHKTAKLHALNKYRRRVILGMKKKTLRKPLQKLTRNVSTRRKSTK